MQKWVIVSILLLMCALFFPPKIRGDTKPPLETHFERTLEEIDQAREDGAEVKDLYKRVENVKRFVIQCGWEKCPQTKKENAIQDLKIIRTEAENRQHIGLGWLFLGLSILGIPILYRYRHTLKRKIQWLIYKNREIKYEEK